MWSVGNEIPEQWKPEGVKRYKDLIALCHQYDPSRMVPCGMDQADGAIYCGFAQVADVPGYNYRLHKYEEMIQRLPQGFILGSETASTVSTRGHYCFPDTVATNKAWPDGQCSGYDVEYCWWSNVPDDDWKMQDDYDWTVGEFVWTGYDYLGEPTPYDEYWPSRSSYFGIMDLAGLPKDRYWLYRSKWNTKEHTVHLLPHWTWPERKGEVTPVYCYTDGVEAELFVNGKSQGRIRKNPAERLDRYRLRWNNVKYEAGEIRVVAYDAQGNKIGEDSRRTAGKPTAIVAQADRKSYRADGEDLVFVTIGVADSKGVAVPTCNNELTFEVAGAGSFEAVCNGDATSLESFKQPRMKLFNGELVVVLRTGRQPGNIRLTIKDSKGKLKAKTLKINTK
jgi:beta-galactosidase